MKPNCYDCIHRRNVPYDAHSECKHPLITDTDRLLTPVLLISGLQRSGVMKMLNISGDESGIKHGWFMWPTSYDPTWLLTCEGFEQKKVSENE